ncbi:coiled-coil domain containing 56 isoform X1 [Xenopus tropicalis]|uniref:Cytochrome c oxidase assembly factor 3 n=1 Tax=Xenopus tropicalis TaxID=8364 RepID=A0A8J0T7B2_XENTR|nr:coiled-coil domain containing 56 isoform X1 [Xenopus tropicalis]|eukprot:XP_017953157.1 PREDICTED: coiled-coil domain containing 56 isoform X4 [Xenopus tropicalis]
MAEKGSPKESVAKYAQRIDPKREKLSPEQQEFMRKTEMAQWRKNAGKLRGRNLVTGLVIGGIVLGIYCALSQTFNFAATHSPSYRNKQN